MTSYMEHKDLSNTDISEARAQEIRAGVASTVEALHNALDRAGRHDSDTTLLAATKTRDVAEILTQLMQEFVVLEKTALKKYWRKQKDCSADWNSEVWMSLST